MIKSLKKRKKIIISTRETTQRFKRISTQKIQETKYNIYCNQIQVEEKGEHQVEEEEAGT